MLCCNFIYQRFPQSEIQTFKLWFGVQKSKQSSYNLHVYRMSSNTLSVCLVILALASTVVETKPIYDFKKSYITQLTTFNFKDQLEKIRQNTNYVSIVHFYKFNDGKSSDLTEAFNTWTNEYNGVYRVGAVDCEQQPKICKDQGIDVFPTFKVYPPVPIPPLELTEDLSVEKIQKTASKYLHSNSIEITHTNLNTFLGENPSVPKVLLFTDKKGTPSVYKGLSVAFQKKLNFGVVRSSDDSLVSKYNIKAFPSIIVIKTGEKKPIFYNGKEFNFREIFEFLNIYSEAFVPGGGSSLDSSATKEWMTETCNFAINLVPEMYDRSAKDICLAVDGTLCVILLTNEKPSKEMKDQFEMLNSKFETKLDRGAKFKFMWLNAAVEQKWGEIFGYSGENKVVVLNPGRRKRYTAHDGPINKDAISQTLDTISGGDARFNRISELPTFTMRA